jgi:hypothetical protein
MFRTLPTRAAAVSGKAIVMPSGDVTLLHATYSCPYERLHVEELDLRDQSSDLALC